MQCKKCGTQIMQGEKTCHWCGAPVQSSNTYTFKQPSIDPIKPDDGSFDGTQKKPNNLPMLFGAIAVAIGLLGVGIWYGAGNSKTEIVTVTVPVTQVVYVTPEPTPNISTPGRGMFDAWMSEQSHTIIAPNNSSYLPELKTGVVRSKYGKGIYARSGPSYEAEKFQGLIPHGETVMVLAVQGEFAVVKEHSNGRVSWVRVELIDY